MSHRTVRDERGVAMTEFALILPVFLVIVAGLLGFGRVFYYWIDANHLANEAARWAAVDRNPYYPTSLQQNVRDSGTVEFQDASVCIDFPAGNSDVGSPVRVSVRKPFNFIPILEVAPITIRGTATMRIERVATGASSAENADLTVNVGTCP